MKKILMLFLCFAFPWLVLFIYDNPGGAVIALVMQATLIGWIPASIWAWQTHTKNQANPTPREPS